jgi:outer membrane protein
VKYATLIILAVMISGTSFAAGDVTSLTLEEAQRVALENHPEIKAATFEAQSSEEDETIARSGYYPQVSGNAVRAFADPNTRIAATSGLNDPTVIDRGSAGIGVSQLITDFGRTTALIDSSKAAVEAQRQRTDLSRTEVLLNVTRAYYDTLRTQAMLNVAQDTLKTRKTLLEQIKSLRDVQMKSDLDLSIANQGVSDAQMLLVKGQNNQAAAMAALSEALGYSEPHDYKLADAGKPKAPSGNIDLLLDAALAQNPELAALKSDYAAAKKAADAAKRESYPTISAVGFVGDTPIRTEDQHINPTYATGGINLTIPFFTGGKLTADTDKATYKEKAALSRIDIKKNKLVRDIHTVFDNVQTAYKNIDLTEQMHRNTRQSLELTQARYDIGKSSIVDLSQAQLAETQAAVAEADTRYDYLIQQAVLKYIVGSLVESP